ncbi:hypothetical protein BST26_21570, partial [Mycolicibacterium insubricum]
FVYENYPLDPGAFTGATTDLTVTGFNIRERNHYPLTLAVLPGTQLGLRFEYDTTQFTTKTITRLAQRFQRALGILSTKQGENNEH